MTDFARLREIDLRIPAAGSGNRNLQVAAKLFGPLLDVAEAGCAYYQTGGAVCTTDSPETRAEWCDTCIALAALRAEIEKLP